MKRLRVDMAEQTHLDSSPRHRLVPSRRILIVEDNYFVAHQCESALREAGYDVVEIVTNAEDAVRVSLERRPELVLMDIYLPGARDGVDAAIEIFKRWGIRSIFASSLSDAPTRARAEDAQPLAWLAKPFNDTKLIATVRMAIGVMDAESQPS